MDRFHELVGGWIELGAPEQVGVKADAIAKALLFKASLLGYPTKFPVSNLELTRLCGITQNELPHARNRLTQFTHMGDWVFRYHKGKKGKCPEYEINYLKIDRSRPSILIQSRHQSLYNSDYLRIDRPGPSILKQSLQQSLSNPDTNKGQKTRQPAENPGQSIEEEIEEDEIEIRDEIEEDDWSYVEKLLCHAPGSPKIMLSSRETHALLELQRKGIPASFAAEVIRQRVREMETKSDVIYNAQMYLIRCIENAWAERRKSSPVVAAPTLRQDGCDRCGRRGVELVETRRGKLCEFCREELGL